MANEAPTISDYEAMGDVEFDFSNMEVDKEEINTRLEEMFSE